MVLVILGIKIQDDNKKLANAEDALRNVIDSSGVTNSQNLINQARNKILQQAANAPAPDTATDVVVKTVTPVKTVTQVAPTSSSSKSSSKSTSSKKTKTS